MTNSGEVSGYRWFIISLAALTNMFAVGVPMMSMPVLFKEISHDLGLSLFKLGAVWGMLGMAGIFTSILGGMVGDRFGAERTISTGCILIGVLGGLRGFSDSFFLLSTTMFAFGMMTHTITMNLHRVAVVWFKGRQVVVANGIVSTGLALGFTIGAWISDTVMSPLLGGWKNVLMFYGVISIFLGFIWMTTNRDKAIIKRKKASESSGFRTMLSHVMRVRNVWFLAFGNLCYSGCLMGFTGYLALYLRDIGWSPASADGALAAFNGAGMLAAIPLSLLASRLGSKKFILIPSMIIGCISVALLGSASNPMIWVLVIFFGLIRDSYFAMLTTMIMETREIGGAYAGTAIGIVWTLGNAGGFIVPPLGNMLAAMNPNLSFMFWAALMAGSVYLFMRVREQREGNIRENIVRIRNRVFNT